MPQDIIGNLPPHGYVSIRSALGWHSCIPSAVVRPTSTEEIADILMALHLAAKESKISNKHKHADINKDNKVHTHFLVRATHQDFFSHNNLSCALSVSSHLSASGAQEGGGDVHVVHGISVDMSQMRHLVELDADGDAVTIQAGMTFEVGEGRD